MKKLIIVLGLSVISSICAMDLARVTDKDISSFSRHLSMAVLYCQQKVKIDKISADNSIYKMLSQLNNELEKHSRNIVTMIESDQDLKQRINELSLLVDNDAVVKFALGQIKQKAADVEAARAYVIRTRQILAGLEFLKKQPTFSNAWINEVNKDDRIGFIERNANYPLDAKSVEDYLDLFIYLGLGAPITD